MADVVRRRRRSSMRGQNLVLAAGLTVLGIVVVLTLREFMASDDNVRRTADPRYLADERTVTGRRRTATAVTADGGAAVAVDGAADAANGGSGGSGTAGSSSTARQRTFSHRGGSAVFASRDGALPRALNPDLRDMVASPEVSVRLLGTSQGDFIYHREYGWMRFVDGHWEPVDIYRLPEDLKKMYPALCGVNTTPGGGGGDAQFSRTDWAASIGHVEEGS